MPRIDRLTATIANGLITLQSRSGPRFECKLPDKKDAAAISDLRDRIKAFCRQHGATIGRTNHALKVLTSNGYYVRGPRPHRRPLTQAETVTAILAQYTEEERREIVARYRAIGGPREDGPTP